MSTGGKKRGLSMDEKRAKVLELMVEKKEVFQLKELEKLAPKEKGVLAQSVKEVVQMLVDDGLVESEKIGTLTCFWAFPSKAVNTKRNRLGDLHQKLNDVHMKRAELIQKIAEAKMGKENTDERETLLSELTSLRAQNSELDSKISSLSDCHPSKLLKLDEDVQSAKASVNRWTDNIFAVQQWCSKKFSIDQASLSKQFGLPDDMDYV